MLIQTRCGGKPILYGSFQFRCADNDSYLVVRLLNTTAHHLVPVVALHLLETENYTEICGFDKASHLDASSGQEGLTTDSPNPLTGHNLQFRTQKG
jgi:hypothetical protein